MDGKAHTIVDVVNQLLGVPWHIEGKLGALGSDGAPAMIGWLNRVHGVGK